MFIRGEKKYRSCNSFAIVIVAEILFRSLKKIVAESTDLQTRINFSKSIDRKYRPEKNSNKAFENFIAKKTNLFSEIS